MNVYTPKMAKYLRIGVIAAAMAFRFDPVPETSTASFMRLP